MFIFNSCHHSLAVVTSVKYECDLKHIIYTFAKSKIALTEKLMNGASVTPTPAGLTLDPSDAETGIFSEIFVNTMAADTLGHSIARPLGDMVLIRQD